MIASSALVSSSVRSVPGPSSGSQYARLSPIHVHQKPSGPTTAATYVHAGGIAPGPAPGGASRATARPAAPAPSDNASSGSAPARSPAAVADVPTSAASRAARSERGVIDTPSQATPTVHGPLAATAIASALTSRTRPRSLTPAAPLPPAAVVSIRARNPGCALPHSQQRPSGATVPPHSSHPPMIARVAKLGCGPGAVLLGWGGGVCGAVRPEELMRRRHHFHIDHAGHSITVNVESGHTSVVEVYVDGKETGYADTPGDRPVTVTFEIFDDPPIPAAVQVQPGPGVPRCFFAEPPDAEHQVMSPRHY